MRALLTGFLDLVSPRRCSSCDGVVDMGAGLFCRSCDVLAERYHDGGAVFEYGGPVAHAIRRFKYEGRSELARALGSRMVQEGGIEDGRVDGVVSVPLHWRRRRARGYDQAALLAGPVARGLGVPMLSRCLRRVRNTPSQVALPRSDRRENVRGAFQSRPLVGAPRLLLIDDVRTTGATLAAASTALLSAGASDVQTLVFAVRVLGTAA